jgi:hypothetical protein
LHRPATIDPGCDGVKPPARPIAAAPPVNWPETGAGPRESMKLPRDTGIGDVNRALMKVSRAPRPAQRTDLPSPARRGNRLGGTLALGAPDVNLLA